MRAIKMNIEQIKETITIVKDYPIKGIVFKDITTLLENPEAFKSTVDIMVDKVKHLDFNRVVGVESRGFFWSGPIAYALSKSFVLARKPGKLPRKAAEKFFSLEYGTNTVHIHEDAIKKGDKVLVVDDLIGLNPMNYKFVKKYANIRNDISKAVSNYSKEVRKINFC